MVWCGGLAGSAARDREPNPNIRMFRWCKRGFHGFIRFRVINPDLYPGKSLAGSNFKLLKSPWETLKEL